jgi:chaperonin GroEL
LSRDPSEVIGAKLLALAMRAPLDTLIQNKLGRSSAHIVEQMEASGDFFRGFDVKREEMCDMMDRGIYDSFSVVRTVLEDAVSLAGMIVTTECILVKEKDYKPMPLKHYQDRREFF